MKILIIEEDDNLLKILCRIIQQKGYETDSAESNTAVLEMMNANTYDLVILDIDLSDHDGLATCQSIRMEYASVPILLLSGKENLPRLIKGLNLGADDFVTKPVHLQELLARIRSLLRRDMNDRNPLLKIQDIRFDTVERAAWKGSRRIHLTRRELSILEYLMVHAVRVVSQEELLEHVWETSVNYFSNTVRVHIHSLRKKLGDDNKKNRYIMTIPGMGYKFLVQPGDKEQCQTPSES